MAVLPQELHPTKSGLFAATHHLHGDTPGDVIIEDVDGNGKLDLMVALPQQAKVALFDGKEFDGRLTCP